MKLVINILSLPPASAVDLSKLQSNLVDAVFAITELGLKSKKDITCSLPKSTMTLVYAPPEQNISIEISGMCEAANDSDDLYSRLGATVSSTVIHDFRQEKIKTISKVGDETMLLVSIGM